MTVQNSSPPARASVPAADKVEEPRYFQALSLLASLFFVWGFITVINNTLLPHLRAVFALSYTQTTLLESVWFIAYFFASMPSAWLIEQIGYPRALVTGLLVMANVPTFNDAERGSRTHRDG
jgi:MFS transporter, FHS family, L-fucose permease